MWQVRKNNRPYVKRQWATTAVNVQTLRPNNMSQNIPFQPLYVANVDNRNDDNHVYNDFTDQENSYGRLGNYDGGDEETAGPGTFMLMLMSFH